MLTSLYVKNFAIIDNINIDFKDKMTVLTGETGAGKSLIIDAIGLLFGKRASSDLIRYGETKATIEGTFSMLGEKLSKLLSEKEIEIDNDDFISIKREIYDNGKSICKINGNTISLSFLEEISELIGDIHTQFDTQKLTNPKNYLQFIDNEEIENELVEYQEALKEYTNNYRKYKELLEKEKTNKEMLSFYKYQISEIEQAKISTEEEEILKGRLNVLNNYELIASNINQFIDLYESNSTLDNIYESINTLAKVEKIDKKYTEYKKQIEDSYYLISEIVKDISSDFNKSEIDFNEIDEINERLGLYSDLKRKYKMSTSELIEYYQKIKNEISNIENFDFILEKITNKTKESYNKTLLLGKNISEKRKILSIDLSKKLIDILEDLHLKDSVFEIKFLESDKVEFKKDGIDTIDFMVSFNKGEPAKPLSKIASGGELSRFMLALKTLVSSKLKLQTLIFDEIDNGVSGKVAYSIANKIHNISNDSQVLCITHLPQVAAIADHQIYISKKDVNGRTITQTKELSSEERVEEIAKMISNDQITEASKNLAQELLKHQF